MADPKIKLKRSSVEGKIPTPDQVPLGEIALNTYDGYLYASKDVGAGVTVIAINPFRVGTGTNTYNAYFTAGNVGIGSEIPTTKLDVDGTVTATGASITGNITVSGTVDGRDVATDGTKLDAIEASADVTDATNVDAAGAVMESDTTTANMSFVVDEDNMASNSATKIPTQQSVKAYVDANAGGGISNVVEDTTPQLGGNLDVNAKNINFGDSASASDDRLNFGAGTDFSIYHDGSNSYIDVDPDASNQHLYIRNNVTTDYGGNIYLQAKSGENSIVCNDDTSVVLYYDNSGKLQTSTTGITVTGVGIGTWKANDNQYLTAGTGDDFQIYHDATNTYLDNDTGHVYIRNNVASDVGGNIYLQAKSGENSIVCNDDSSVVLYYDNSAKLQTTTTGVTITGALSVTTLDFTDNQKIRFGTDLDAEIYHDGTDTYLDNDTGHVYIRNNVASDVGGNIYLQAKSGENSIVCNDDSSVVLYYDNSGKLQTSTTGITVTGTGLADGWKVNDSEYFTAGTGDDFQIYHDATNTYLDNATGHLYIRNAGANDNSNIYIQAVDGENSIVCNDDSSVLLYHDNSLKLQTSTTGITITGTGIGDGWKVGDSEYFTAGTGDDFQIYHDGTNTYLDNDTGSIYIRGNVAGDVGGDVYIQAKSGENSIVCLDDSEVRLYYDNAEKLNTSSTGVTITGTLSATDVSVASGHAIINNSGANITGVTTSTSFVKSSNSGGFLKADGTEDTSTYLTSYTETDPVVAAINGIVKSDGTTISAATAGTDYLTPSGDGSGLTGLTGASAATYGSAGATPVIVVDSDGRITGISTAAISGGGSIGIQSGGTSITSEASTINFVGTGITMADDGSVTDITIPTISRTTTRVVATDAQTAFTVAAYDSSLIDVYLNGVKLDSTEYATTNSTTITLTTGASTGDIFESVSYTNFSGANASSVTVADESSDTTCFVLFAKDSTGNQQVKTDSSALTYNASTGTLAATSFAGDGSNLTGVSAGADILESMLFS